MAAATKKFYYEFDVKTFYLFDPKNVVLLINSVIICLLLQAFEHLSNFINETNQKIEISKKRLAEQQAEISAEVKAKVSCGICGNLFRHCRSIYFLSISFFRKMQFRN